MALQSLRKPARGLRPWLRRGLSPEAQAPSGPERRTAGLRGPPHGPRPPHSYLPGVGGGAGTRRGRPTTRVATARAGNAGVGSKAAERGVRGGRQDPAGRDRQTPGGNPGCPGERTPAHQTHTHCRTFSGLSMARGHDATGPVSAASEEPPRARSRREFESPAQPQ